MVNGKEVDYRIVLEEDGVFYLQRKVEFWFLKWWVYVYKENPRIWYGDLKVSSLDPDNIVHWLRDVESGQVDPWPSRKKKASKRVIRELKGPKF